MNIETIENKEFKEKELIMKATTRRICADFECFQNEHGQIVKEFGSVEIKGFGNDSACINNSQQDSCPTVTLPYGHRIISHFIFGPPHSSDKLAEKWKRVNQWIVANLHGIGWADGQVDYVELEHIVRRVIGAQTVVFTKGQEKCALLAKILNEPSVTIINIEELGMPRIVDLPVPFIIYCCWYHSAVFRGMATKNHCALGKADIYAQWLLDNHQNLEDACNKSSKRLI